MLARESIINSLLITDIPNESGVSWEELRLATGVVVRLFQPVYVCLHLWIYFDRKLFQN